MNDVAYTTTTIIISACSFFILLIANEHAIRATVLTTIARKLYHNDKFLKTAYDNPL